MDNAVSVVEAKEVTTTGLPDGTTMAKQDDEILSGRLFTVRRDGKPPARFRGQLLIEANNYSTHRDTWHEVNIYKRLRGGYVVEIKSFKKFEEEQDSFLAYHCHTVEDITSLITSYDPIRDLTVEVNPNDETLSMCELTLKAIALRKKSSGIKMAWDAMVGGLLLQLHRTQTSFE